MQARRDGFVSEDERDFDEAGHAGGGFEMADVGFDRADEARIFPVFAKR